jgi:HSP20 family protein
VVFVVDNRKINIKEDSSDDENEGNAGENPHDDESHEIEGESGNETNEEPKLKELAIRRSYPFPLFQHMDRIFDKMTRDFDRSFWRPFSIRHFDRPEVDIEPIFRTPLANVSEDDTAYSIAAELPGLEKGDIEITMHEGKLEIKGEKKEKHEEKKGNLVRKEFSSSSYSRVFQLPDNADQDADIDATLEKGILNIKIPKKEQEPKEKKKIEIK